MPARTERPDQANHRFSCDECVQVVADHLGTPTTVEAPRTSVHQGLHIFASREEPRVDLLSGRDLCGPTVEDPDRSIEAGVIAVLRRTPQLRRFHRSPGRHGLEETSDDGFREAPCAAQL